jgi:hypothetical protein
MQTLTATRDYKGHLNCVTTLKDSNGFVRAVLTGYHQPKLIYENLQQNPSIIIR